MTPAEHIRVDLETMRAEVLEKGGMDVDEFERRMAGIYRRMKIVTEYEIMQLRIDGEWASARTLKTSLDLIGKPCPPPSAKS